MTSDDKTNIDLYRSFFRKYGNDLKTLNWGSVQSQELRFKVMAEIGALADTHILDVGCGLGDFFFWLQRIGIPVRYTGIDLTPELATATAARLPEADIRNATIFDLAEGPERFDFVFASGIFCFRKENPVEYLQRTVAAMFQLCRQGVAFNSLSAWLQNADHTEFFANPPQILDFCHTLTPRVTLRHDYHPGDFTVYLYRTTGTQW